MNTEGRNRLHDVRQAAEALSRFVAGRSMADFREDEMLQAAEERKLEIIGEAFARLESEDPLRRSNFPICGGLSE